MSEHSAHDPSRTELDRLILTRRSIRRYKPQPPPDECIEDLIRAAAWAPSPSNSQPVRFYRIRSDAIRNRLRKSMEDGRKRLLGNVEDGSAPGRLKNWINVYWRYSVFMLDAPVLLAAGTLERVDGFSTRLFEADLCDQPDQMHADLALTAGMAIKGFMLKATEQGLGTCMLTAPLSFIARPEAILGIDGVHILGFVTLGVPDESPEPPKRGELSSCYRQL